MLSETYPVRPMLRIHRKVESDSYPVTNHVRLSHAAARDPPRHKYNRKQAVVITSSTEVLSAAFSAHCWRTLTAC